MESVRHDARFAFRILVRKPGFSLFAVGILALGIGANTAIFSMVNAVLLRPLALRQPDRVLTIWESRQDVGTYPISIPDFLDLQEQNRTLASMAALAMWNTNLSGEETPERVTGIQVTGGFFETLGAQPALGRLLRPSDAQAGSPRVVVLGFGFWKRHYAGDPGVVGREIRLNGLMYTVVGVMPADLIYRRTPDDVVVPLIIEEDRRRAERNDSFLRGLGRMRPGVAVSQVPEDLNAILKRLQQQYPASNAGKTGSSVEVLQDSLVGNVRGQLVLIQGAVLAVLLVACANLAGLLLVRTSARGKEIAIRASLGASRGRILRQLLVESMMLAAAGGALGLALAAGGLRALLGALPAALPRAGEIHLDAPVLGFTALLSLFCGLIFGIAPALELSHADLHAKMKAGAQSGARQRLRHLLVMAQVAASLVLLVGSGLLLRSFLRLSEVQPGFSPSNVLVARLALPATQYKGNEEVFHFYRELARRAEALPGVRSVAVANVVPTDGFLASVEFSIVGRGWTPADFPSAHYRMVSSGYFRTLQIPLLAGREFLDTDNVQGAPVVIITQACARRFWPAANPLGAHIEIDDLQSGMRQVEVVGVVGDIHDFGLDREAQLEVYVPLPQVPPETVSYLKSNMYWLLRTATDPQSVAEVFRREVQAVDRDVPATSVRTLEQYLDQSLAARKFSLVLVGIFGAAALLIAAMGIYGVVSYTVVLRTPEIGVRLALGAQPAGIFRLVLGHGLRLVAAGLAAGLLAALLVLRMGSGMLFETSTADPATYITITALLFGVAVLACYWPGRRAMAVDPLVALRAE